MPRCGTDQDVIPLGDHDLACTAAARGLKAVSPAGTRTLEVLRREANGWLLVATHTGDERVRAEPFDAVELGLGLLWLPEAHPEP